LKGRNESYGPSPFSVDGRRCSSASSHHVQKYAQTLVVTTPCPSPKTPTHWRRANFVGIPRRRLALHLLRISKILDGDQVRVITYKSTLRLSLSRRLARHPIPQLIGGEPTSLELLSVHTPGADFSIRTPGAVFCFRGAAPLTRRMSFVVPRLLRRFAVVPLCGFNRQKFVFDDRP